MIRFYSILCTASFFIYLAHSLDSVTFTRKILLPVCRSILMKDSFKVEFVRFEYDVEKAAKAV